MDSAIHHLNNWGQKSMLPTDDQHADQEEFVAEPLTSFKPLFQHQEAQIIQNALKKSCLFDPGYPPLCW